MLGLKAVDVLLWLWWFIGPSWVLTRYLGAPLAAADLLLVERSVVQQSIVVYKYRSHQRFASHSMFRTSGSTLAMLRLLETDCSIVGPSWMKAVRSFCCSFGMIGAAGMLEWRRMGAAFQTFCYCWLACWWRKCCCSVFGIKISLLSFPISVVVKMFVKIQETWLAQGSL